MRTTPDTLCARNAMKTTRGRTAPGRPPGTEAAGDLDRRVDALADPDALADALRALLAAGAPGRAALIRGLRDGRWRVRRACLYGLYSDGSAESAVAAAELLHDARANVRAVAVAVVGAGSPDPEAAGRTCHPEAVPLLLERLYHDDSIKVRRQALLQLAWFHAHPQLEDFFASLLASETDRKLHQWAGIGMLRCRGESS